MMVSSLRDALCMINGVVESDSAFKDDLAFWVNGTEIAHFESDDAIDIRLTRAEIRARRADPRVVLRGSSSDWLTAVRRSAQDEDFVVGLVRIAASAHQQAAGFALPPTGAALARWRRFH